MKNFRLGFYIFLIFNSIGFSANSMEIIFGKKYSIGQKANTNQLAWLSVEFEKDLTGKVVYKLTATHPSGVKLSYLKGKDYLLSEEIQRNMVRNFEVKNSDVDFGPDKTVTYEVVLPYDFQTRYLPLKFEKKNGIQEIVVRLRFGDYRFMLASRVLNSISFVDKAPVVAAKSVDTLFNNRSQLKKRPPKEAPKELVSNVNVDDIYNNIKSDLNIKSRIVTDPSQMQNDQMASSEPSQQDALDSLVSQYLPSDPQERTINPNNLNASGRTLDVSGSEISFEDSQKQQGTFDVSNLPKDQQDIFSNTTTDSDYTAYLDDLVEEKKNTDFDADASVDDIIAQAGAFDKPAANTNSYGSSSNTGNSNANQGLNKSTQANNSEESSLDTSTAVVEEKPEPVPVKKKKPVYVPPVDTEELFGFAPSNWSEPEKAPVLVIKPKPVSVKRRISSIVPPKRNNFVEMVPSKKPKTSSEVMGDLFGGSDSGMNSSGFGF